MKIVGIGDLLIPKKYIEEAFNIFTEKGHILKTVQWEINDYDKLQNINLNIEQNGANAIDPDDNIISEIEDADIIITQFFPVNKKVIDRCKNLKMVGVLRGGYENIDISYASQKGILVYNTPGRNANAVADFTIGMILSEVRNIARAHFELKNGKWIKDYSNKGYIYDLTDKTIGLIGFGEIGKKVAKRLEAFDMNILFYDPYVKEYPDYVEKVELEELLAKSHFVSLHSRLSKDNKHVINDRTLNLMRKDSYLINTARSGLVDEEALYKALKEKRILGAALDVFDKEPTGANYPLIKLENVTVTPHLAGGSTDAFTNSPKLLAKELLDSLDNGESRFIVNRG